jgi:HEAT repeat protein
MSRFAFIVPLCLAGSLSAQVITTPRVTTVMPSTPVWVNTPLVTSWPDLSYTINNSISTALTTVNDFAWSDNYNLQSTNYLSNQFVYSGFGEARPVAWAQQDPADSLYRMARDQFSRGDYRRSAELFKSLPQKFPSSVYIPDAQYWQAFSLYRIGGTTELKEALTVLETRQPPTQQEGSRRGQVRSTTIGGNQNVVVADVRPLLEWRGNQVDAAGLAARIAGVLSSRGLANDPSVKRALAAGGDTCDQDDQAVRAEALNALMQNDPETGRQMAWKILGNRDECSIPLRRNAVMLVGNKHDDAAVSTLVPVAKSDPSQGVRLTAIEYLVRAQNDAGVNAVIEIARSDTSSRMQRAAVNALAQSTNARARAEIRNVIENSTTNEQLRMSAIDGLDRDRITAEDGAWLRSLYAKTTNTRVKERIISAIGRAGGEANDQWLLALVRNEDEPLESRTTALNRAGRNLDVPTLSRMYDASSARPIRETVIDLLSARKEPGALDKLVDIARNGTDPAMRRQAISILARSKDPRAAKLLLQLVDK